VRALISGLGGRSVKRRAVLHLLLFLRERWDAEDAEDVGPGFWRRGLRGGRGTGVGGGV